MRICQAVFGVFHHFDLARELDRRGHLRQIYSTWPWARLKREELPHSKVQTFSSLHLAQMLAGKYLPSWRWAYDELGYATALRFDDWLDRRLPYAETDALVAISGAGLKTGKRLQQHGGVFVCDRGSTHLAWQQKLFNDECRRWAVEQSTDIRYTRREEAIYEAADAITVPSDFAARSFIESGIPKEKMHVIPYGVRLEKFQPVGEPPSNTFEVLFVGQVGLRKGLPYLLEAFARLEHPRKRLRIIGSVVPEFKPVLARLPQDHVEFLGKLPQSELPLYMSSSHVIALPSIEEGLALVQGQAMACGCPVLSSANTGAENLFSDGVEGFIVPIRDPDSLQDRLQQLADDPGLQGRMREAALQRVQSLGGWRDYGDKWVSLLERLLVEKRSSHIPIIKMEPATREISI